MYIQQDKAALRIEHQLTTYNCYLDGDAVLSRQQAMDEARRRMQKQYDAQAAYHAEEMKKVPLLQNDM